MSEHMLVWVVSFNGGRVVWPTFWQALAEWKSIRDDGDRGGWMYPRLMLKGEFHRKLREGTGR